MRLVVVAIQIVLAAASLWSQDILERWAGGPSETQLRAGTPVTRSIASDGVLSLIPPVSSRASIGTEMADFHPSVGIEYLQLVGGANTAPAGRTDWLRLYNVLHAASTMQGVTYWSVTRGKQEVLFSQSYAVDSPASRQRIPDPSASVLPTESLFYTFQEDRSFGRNTYEEVFSFPGDHLAVRIANMTAISLVLIPVIAPRGFVVRIVLAPAGRQLLFYGAAAVRSSMPLGDRRSREQSLVNRLAAMTAWLNRQVAGQGQP